MDISFKRYFVNFKQAEINSKDPIELLKALEDTFSFIKGKMDSIRREPELDLELWQQIQIDWGEWSHNFNKGLRARIKNCDQFPENDNQRFIAKRLNLIFLYWSKCFLYIEAVAENNPLKNGLRIFECIELMKEAKEAFIQTKEEALPKWV